MRTLRVLAIAVFAACLPTFARAQQPPTGCSTVEQNLYVRNVMTDLYLWYQAVPDVDPAAFDSPEAYLETVRFRPVDQTFSYITSRQANDALYSASQYIGFGFSTIVTASRELRVTQVFDGSPAARAGLGRGDRIVEIDGLAVTGLVTNGHIGSAFGPSEIGFESDIGFLHGSSRVTARLMKTLVTIPTVSLTRVYQIGSRTVGYVFFRNFVEPSYAALDRAFGGLAGIDELVLDLRYNGGGLVSVAQHLASLIGGARTDGHVFAEFFHNDRNSSRNHVLRFASTPNAASLSRVVVLTTRASASASELVINALRPFLPVIIIGDRTYGKPVGQYGLAFCDKVLAPVSFALRNANREGDFFDGLQPTCTAADDLDHQFGDPREASLSEAFAFIESGHCSGPERARTTTAGDAQSIFPFRSEWQAAIGAH